MPNRNITLKRNNAGTTEELYPTTDWAQINNKPSTFTPTSHSHGNITNGGAITANATIASGDHLVIADNSASNALTTSSITFGTGTTTFLRNDGTWGTPAGTADTNNYLTGVSGSGDGTVTFTRQGLSNLTWNAAHSHSEYLEKTGGTMTGTLTIDTGSSTNALAIKGTSPTISLLDDSTGQDDFYIHANSNNFYILTNRDGDDQVGTGFETPHPLQLEADTNIGYLFGSRMFADNYHPNADKWTTARTITLGGDLVGNVSLDGSANVTLSAAVANDSHTHDGRYYTESEVNTYLAAKAPLASPVLTGIPTAPTAAANTNTTQIATTAYVQQEITDLIGGAPGALDTLNELAAAINDDASYASTITTALAAKAPLASPSFTGNVSVSGTITANGLTVSNDNIVGVNQLEINDPGEGIVFKQGSSGDMTLAITDDSFDSILNFSGTNAALAVNGTTVSLSGHNHDSRYYTESEVDTLLAGKAASSHTHDDRYYTETESNTRNFRRDTSNSADVRFTAAHGRGVRFWDSDNYKIWMSSATDGTWGGRLDSNSDYNMYFRMSGGTNRGFVFQNSSTEVFQIESDGDVRFTGTLNQGTVPWARLSNVPDPTITLTGAVTGSGTMTNLGNVSIATTATADPTLTINGDASGSATFTNLGNATLTLTVNDDSHNHTIANVDGLQTALNGKASSSHNHSASEIVTGELNTARMGSGTATSGYVLKSDGDGTASWQQDNNTTYSLGSFGVTATAAELNKMDGVTATTTELNYTDGVTSNIQTQLNGKLSTSAAAAAVTYVTSCPTSTNSTGMKVYVGSTDCSTKYTGWLYIIT